MRRPDRGRQVTPRGGCGPGKRDTTRTSPITVAATTGPTPKTLVRVAVASFFLASLIWGAAAWGGGRRWPPRPGLPAAAAPPRRPVSGRCCPCTRTAPRTGAPAGTGARCTPGCGARPVGSSGLGADAVVHGEQAGGVVAVLDLGEAGVVVAPKRCLPVVLEVVGFGEVGGGRPGEGFERCHGGGDVPGVLACFRDIGLVAGDAGVGRGLVGPGDGQREGVQGRGVHR